MPKKEISPEQTEEQEKYNKEQEFMEELDKEVLGKACPLTEVYIKNIERWTLEKLSKATNLRDAEIIINLGKYRINLLGDLVKRCKEIPEELEKKEEGEKSE